MWERLRKHVPCSSFGMWVGIPKYHRRLGMFLHFASRISMRLPKAFTSLLVRLGVSWQLINLVKYVFSMISTTVVFFCVCSRPPWIHFENPWEWRKLFNAFTCDLSCYRTYPTMQAFLYWNTNLQKRPKTKPQSRQMLRLAHLRCNCCIEGADHVHLNLGRGIVATFAHLAFTVIYSVMFSGWLNWLFKGLDISWRAWNCKYLDWVLCRVICRLGTIADRVYHCILGKARPRRMPVQVWSRHVKHVPRKRRGSQRAEDHTIKCLPDSGLNGSEPFRTQSASHPLRV